MNDLPLQDGKLPCLKVGCILYFVFQTHRERILQLFILRPIKEKALFVLSGYPEQCSQIKVFHACLGIFDAFVDKSLTDDFKGSELVVAEFESVYE
jgi:hypothetical protein